MIQSTNVDWVVDRITYSVRILFHDRRSGRGAFWFPSTIQSMIVDPLLIGSNRDPSLVASGQQQVVLLTLFMEDGFFGCLGKGKIVALNTYLLQSATYQNFQAQLFQASLNNAVKGLAKDCELLKSAKVAYSKEVKNPKADAAKLNAKLAGKIW
nr:hypothetical protein Iba_chr04fCG14650 [Ipomoea batatas]